MIPYCDVKHYSDGTIFIKEWKFNGKYHREDGPSVIVNNQDGKVIQEDWYIHGVKHREDGPAETRFKYPNPIPFDDWYIKGEWITYQVNVWIDKMALPPPREWGNDEKILFKLTFMR